MRRLAGIPVCSLAILLAAVVSAHADDRVRVALLPLVVRSSEGRDYLQQGLADMLVARLARSERLAVVPIDDLNAATDDATAARKIGLANGAEFVVYGSFTRFGEGASLELRCASVRDTKTEPRHIYVHANSMGELLPMLDGVADRTTYAVLGPTEEAPAVSTGPAVAPKPPNAPSADQPAIPKKVHETDTSIGNRDRRAPGLPSESEGDVLR